MPHSPTPLLLTYLYRPAPPMRSSAASRRIAVIYGYHCLVHFIRLLRCPNAQLDLNFVTLILPSPGNDSHVDYCAFESPVPSHPGRELTPAVGLLAPASCAEADVSSQLLERGAAPCHRGCLDSNRSDPSDNHWMYHQPRMTASVCSMATALVERLKRPDKEYQR